MKFFGPDRRLRAALFAVARRSQARAANQRATRTTSRALAGVLVGVVALLVGGGAADAREFKRVPISVPEFKLFDLGAVDFDGDGDLDVYTNNHLGPSGLLANDGEGGFEDVLTQRGLDHTPAFPGWEAAPHDPDTSEPGLYVYRSPGRIVLEHVAAGSSAVSGTVELATGAGVERSAGVEVGVSKNKTSRPPRTTLKFSSDRSFSIRVKPDRATLPVKITVDRPFPLSSVHVGDEGTSPTTRAFTLLSNDRHGVAWADLIGNSRTDAFIVRGGVSGDIAQYGGLVQDELMLNKGSRFRNAQPGSGLRKGSCRSRAAAAVDVDHDGRLDLFVTCTGSEPAKLYRQRPGGRFRNESGALRDAGITGTRFEWLDLDGDRRLELLVAKRSSFIVYRRAENGSWVRDQPILARRSGKSRNHWLTVGDYDRDGDPDVFVGEEESDENVLLVNRDGRLRARDPRRLGLPSGPTTAVSWVDFNNDGRLDLHAIPQGLFKQGRSKRFRRTGELKSARGVNNAALEWFDYDGDGDRDALIATQPRKKPVWPTRLLENRGRDNHWLEVELTGRPGNREAVGARVRVRSGGRTQTQWVGQSGGSRYSQGHYRLYFGLGGRDTVKRIAVEWPRGKTTRLKDVGADRILRIRR